MPEQVTVDPATLDPATLDSATQFEKHAREDRTGLVREFFGFMSENRKWWLFPVLAFVLSAGALVLLAGTGAAPFIYTLF